MARAAARSSSPSPRGGAAAFADSDERDERAPLAAVTSATPASVASASTSAAAAAAAPAPLLALPLSTRLVLLNISLYAVAYMMQVPSQPFFVSRLSRAGAGAAAAAGGGAADASVNDAAMAFGVFRSYIQVLQLVGTIASGFLIDRLGARALFGLSFAASALAYGLTAYAVSLPLLYASMLPTVLQHAMLGARAFVTQQAPDADRARQMGFLKVAYGVGMVFGPSLGGYLVAVGDKIDGGEDKPTAGAMWLISITAAALSTLSLGIVLLIGNPEPPAAAAAAAASAGKGSSSSSTAAASAAPAPAPQSASVADYLALLSSGAVAALLLLKLLFASASAMFHGAFTSPAAVARFGLGATASGNLLTFVGLVGGLTNAFLVAPMQRRFSERALLIATSALLAASYAAFSAVSTQAELWLLCVPLVVASSLLETVLSAQLTRLVPARLAGTSNALDMGVGSGVRIVSPVLSAALLTSSAVGFSGVGLVSAALMALCVLLLSAGGSAAATSASAGGAAGAAARAGSGAAAAPRRRRSTPGE